MNHQAHPNMFSDPSNPPDRSPENRHVPYGSGFQNAMAALSRGGQLPPSSLYADQPTHQFSPRGIDHMSPLGGYMLDNMSNQAWNYNTANVSTVNGPVNGPGRQRTMNRRAPLPTAWPEPPMHPMPYQPGFAPPGMMNGLRIDMNDMRPQGGDDQLIPTAIVIKNIPFAVRKETLAEIMHSLNLPAPYAFNYHFDNGVFRGLAFANFQSADDTRVVIEAMNGLEVSGRKLRVEYKKMLPEAERERIEREKRERRGQLEEQHKGPMLHAQSSIQSLASMSTTQSAVRPSQSPLSMAPIPNAAQLRSPANNAVFPEDLDLNDPETLGFYTELTIFRRDDNREIFIFPSTMTPEQRRRIHILAHNMGLEHKSVGESDSRQIHVIKHRMPSPVQSNSVGLDIHKRGLSRAATFDFAADREARTASHNFSSHHFGRHGPTLEVTGSPDGSNVMPNSLRTAKSFADLRSFSPSPSQSSAAAAYLPTSGSGFASSAASSSNNAAAHFGAYSSHGGGVNGGSVVTPNLTPTTPGHDLMINTFGGLNLGSMDPVSTVRANPGTIGSQRPGQANRSAPERQPRGPEWETSAGFSRRANGHMPHGSDSSDSISRGPTNSRF